MLRKTGYIILTSLLILSTVGFVISRHYCDQILISTAIDLPADPCDHEGGDDCCNTENITVILKVDFIQPVSKNISVYESHVLGFENQEQNEANTIGHVTEVPEILTLHPQHRSAFLAEIQSFLL